MDEDQDLDLGNEEEDAKAEDLSENVLDEDSTDMPASKVEPKAAVCFGHKDHSTSIRSPATKEESGPSTVVASQFASTVSNRRAEYIQTVRTLKTDRRFHDRSCSGEDVSLLGFVERQKLYYEQQQASRKASRKRADELAQQECTFRPVSSIQKRNAKSLSRSSSDCRSFASFMRDQQIFAEEKALRAVESVRGRLDAEAKELRFVPRINPVSEALAAGRSRTGVYTRLQSAECTARKRRDLSPEPPMEPSIMPPASRRKIRRNLNKSMSAATSRHRNEHLIPVQTSGRLTTRTDRLYASRRVEKELAAKFAECSASGKLTFDSFCMFVRPTIGNVLAGVGMMNEHSGPSERGLAESMWNMLGGTKAGGVALSPLRRLMHAIMRTNPKAGYVTEGARSPEPHQQFYKLYLNKVAQRKRSPEPPKRSHTPTINRNAATLARQYQERVNGTTRDEAVENVMEALCDERARRFRDYKIRLHNDQNSQCTFRPQVLRPNAEDVPRRALAKEADNYCSQLARRNPSRKQKVSSSTNR